MDSEKPPSAIAIPLTVSPREVLLLFARRKEARSVPQLHRECVASRLSVVPMADAPRSRPRAGGQGGPLPPLRRPVGLRGVPSQAQGWSTRSRRRVRLAAELLLRRVPSAADASVGAV